MPKIDWTKPIEFVSSVFPNGIPARFVGECDGLFYITTHSNRYANAYTADGVIVDYPSNTIAHIRNVPPPKIEKTLVIVLWKDGIWGVRNPEVDNTKGDPNVIAKKTITITEGEGL